jgi:hypothetical protein
LEEIRLIRALAKSSDTRGLIGRVAEESLQRFPSIVYWSGLRTWGICLFEGSREEYHHSLDNLQWRQQRLYLDRDREMGPSMLPSPNWDPRLPDRPENLFQAAGFTLSKAEALYLRDRIVESGPHSLLANLIDSSSPVAATYVWNHPAIHELPSGLRQAVQHAQNFSETIQGAVVMYNLLLAQGARSDAAADRLMKKLSDWTRRISERRRELLRWSEDLDGFWMSPAFAKTAIPRQTRAFLRDWLNLTLGANEAGELLADGSVLRLIRDREFRLKGDRAKLSYPGALTEWGGAYGTRRLDFRWTVAKRFLSEIVQGLR